jgi:hypothetical protein
VGIFAEVNDENIEHRDYFRKFKESIYIRSLEVKMNIQNGTQVNPIWCTSLVNFLKF